MPYPAVRSPHPGWLADPDLMVFSTSAIGGQTYATSLAVDPSEAQLEAPR